MSNILRDLTRFVFGLIDILLIFRFLLKLLAADPAASFVHWVYETTGPLLNPFIPAFPTPRAADGFILEFTTLFAIFIYTFIGYLLLEFLNLLSSKE